MKQEIEGICLKKIPYNDSLQIAYILTAEYGVLPFLVRNKTKNNLSALFMPLSILKLHTYIRNNKDIQHLDFANSEHILLNIYDDVNKLNVAQFFAEFLYVLSPYPHSDTQLFLYIKNWILYLEQCSNKYTRLIHIHGLFKLTKFFGIEPNYNFSEKNCLFDLVQAQFTHIRNDNTLSKEISDLWYKFLSYNIDHLALITLNKDEKSKLLNSILQYYSIHTQFNFSIQSLNVLKEFYEVY